MDLTFKCGLYLVSDDVGVNATHHGTDSEVNPLQITVTRDYYAWLDAVEEEHVGHLDYFKLDPKKALVPVDKMSPSEGSELFGSEFYAAYSQSTFPQIGVATFDCIEKEYFNKNIDALRSYYAQARGEDIDAAHNIQKDYFHSSQERDLHRYLIQQFYANAPSWSLVTVHVAFVNHTAAWHSLLRLFPRCAWYGLTLTNADIGWDVGVVDNPTDDLAPLPVRLVAFHDVTDVRRNNLEHIVSLDFAPDVPWSPDLGPIFPPPVPVLVPEGTPHHDSSPTMSTRLKASRKNKAGTSSAIVRMDDILRTKHGKITKPRHGKHKLVQRHLLLRDSIPHRLPLIPVGGH